jgi:hypothetical protein
MKAATLFLFALVVCATVARAQMLQSIDPPKVKADLIEYVKTHYQSPEDYILSKFKDHDIVFLGEWHRIKHDPELVQKLIPLLYRSGVYYLGLEFARREEQPMIDSLLRAPEYNEQLARYIVFKHHVLWGYKEYVDIFKAAWQLNRSLPGGSGQFRILGLNNSPDWSFVKTPEDRDKYEVMSKVWHGETEEDYAKVLIDVVISKGEKALVYSGIHHAFTEYKQPIAINGKFIRFGDTRMGNFVFQKIGKRAFTIFLHAPWISADGYDKPLVHSADGYIDAVLNELDPKYQRVGFDLKGTPFGKLPGGTSIYKFGYDFTFESGYDHFTLERIYDGYVCQGPLSAYEGVTPIKDFINEQNIDEASAQSPEPSLRKMSADDLNKYIAENADASKGFSTLK